jgi:hypothetical protein
MRTILEPGRETLIAGSFDVVVAGAGTAGIVAAIAAARQGAGTLLLERGGFVGGHIASQLLEHSEGWYDSRGNQIVGGLPQELVDRLIACGASPGHVRDDTGYTRMRVPINHDEFKSIASLMVAEAGVKTLLHSPIVAVMHAGRAPAGLIVENKSGRQAYEAKVVVDCTGDADIACLAGAAFHRQGRADGLTQPVSLLFKIGGIDFNPLLDYVEAHPEDFKLGVEPSALRGQDHVNLWGFGQLLARGHQAGVVSLFRNELHFSGWTRTGEAVVNVTRHSADGADAEELSAAEVVLRRQVLEFVQFFRAYVPGCSHVFLAGSAACVGVRETRRILGLATLTDQDVMRTRRRPDGIAQGGFPIDAHDPMGTSMEFSQEVSAAYDIPYGCLVPQGVRGLLVAGRCISAERRALASARITGTCMAMGQAAGTAAALCAKGSLDPKDLPVVELQRALLGAGAFLGPETLCRLSSSSSLPGDQNG